MIEVTDNFHKAAFGQIINPIVRLYVSFDKQLNDGGFFTLDESVLDGSDILKFAASDADTQAGTSMIIKTIRTGSCLLHGSGG